MKTLLRLIILLMPLAALAQAPHTWMHVYHHGHDFNSFKVKDITEISHTGGGYMLDDMVVETADGAVSHIPMSDILKCVFAANVPTLYVNITDHPEMTDLVDKETYLNATLRIDGNGLFDDLDETPLQIKGRGNSTWGYPKKPYRFKFPSKISLLDMTPAKNYALIANYIDCSLMRNTFAFECARQLGMPFTNHTVPVRVVFNGIDKGAYFVSEKIGINKASVDIDEATGLLLELDTNYDEPYKFRTPIYDLPVMVKDPDFDKLAKADGIAPDERLEMLKADFCAMEACVHNGDDYSTYVDMQSLIDYMIVYAICGNQEINHPKSLYMYKRSLDDKYHFGPVWDFDWAFTYYAGNESTKASLVTLSPGLRQGGGRMLRDMCRSAEFMSQYRERWQWFKTEKLPLVLDYIDEYADLIEPSAIENGVLWPAVPGCTASSFEFRANVAALKQWIADRVTFIDSHPTLGLY